MEELRQLVEITQSKIALTLKRCPRMVACRDFCQKQEGQELHAGGGCYKKRQRS